MTAKIYSLSDPKNGLVRYIGKTSRSLESRLLSHLSDKTVCRRTSWIKSLREKNTLPIIGLIENTFDDQWQEREKYWIQFYLEAGYDLVNGTRGGDGYPGGPSAGYIRSTEARRKSSEALRGKKRSIESIQKQKNTITGRPHSKEHTERVAKRHRGMKRSEEAKKRMRESHRNRQVSKETREKMSRAHKGKKLSDEVREKMQQAQLDRYKNPYQKNKQSDVVKFGWITRRKNQNAV